MGISATRPRSVKNRWVVCAFGQSLILSDRPPDYLLTGRLEGMSLPKKSGLVKSMHVSIGCFILGWF